MKQLTPEETGIFQVHPVYRQPMRNTVIIVALLAIGAVLTLPLSVISSMRGISGYLPLHMLFETFAVIVAMLVFAVGWHAHSRKLPGNIVLLACTFFGVGLLDFAHMISYAGMPDFVTPNNPEKGIDFWLAARSLAAAALLAVSVLPWRPFASGATRYALLAGVTAATTLAYWLILFHQDSMPHTFIPGQGLTAFKIFSEYTLIALNLAAALMLWLRMRKPQPFNVTALFGAVCVMALSEYFFTLYSTVTDVFNLLGHVYKAIAYLLLYRAIFVAAIENPYRELHASEAKLHTLYDSTSDAVMIVDEHGFIDCNKATLALFGCATREEFCSKHPADISPPVQPCGTDSHVLVSQNNAAAIKNGNHQFEWMCRRMDTGAVFPADVLLSRMVLVGKTVLQGTVRDITARKQAEQALRANELQIAQNEARLRIMLSTAIDGVIGCDADGRLLEFNPAAEAMFGWRREEIIGQQMAELLVPGQHRAAHRDGMARFLRTHEPKAMNRIIEISALRRDGTEFPIELSITTFKDGERDFFTAYVRDISGRKQAESEILRLNAELEHRIEERTRQLEAANKELEAFSYSVSHDLRTPLRSIDGFSQVLLKKYHAQLDATGKDYLERVIRASQHMGHLISDMLQLSQVSRHTLKRIQFSLSGLAEILADELRASLPGRQLRFTLQEGLLIHADTGLIRIVMENLLGNAVKYTGNKTVAEIEFGTRAMNGEETFFVRDNGAGFNMNYAHKLFAPFQRLHGTDEFEGTGIGLATVQRIIHRHHGKVWAEAVEGQGATFFFTLPQRDPEKRRHDGS